MAINVSHDGDLQATGTIAAELERDRDQFPFNYLPGRARRLLREAFACYSADLFLAFALLCRRAVAVAANAAPANEDMRFEILFDDAVRIAGVDSATREELRAALFGIESDPEITACQAAILIEIVKDMFQQRFVRTAKLRRAIQVRQLFADIVRHRPSDD